MLASATHQRAALIVAALAFIGSYLLYPVESDAAYAINDALWNALMAEGDDEHVVSGHHPMFHIAAHGVAAVLDAVGVEQRGLHAVKVLSALSASAILGLIVAAAGARRWWFGVLVATTLASTRGFWIEAGTGENVLLGVAFGLYALRAALDDRCRLSRVGIWVVLALLARQDNILLLPAWAYGLWQRMPAESRLKRLVLWGAVSGIATLGLYFLIWWAFSEENTFLEWLTYTSTHNKRAVNGSWSSTGGVITLDVVEQHIAALSVSVVGLLTFDRIPNLIMGIAFVASLLGAGFLDRGSRRARPLLIAAGIMLATRLPFYLWFEPSNFEWWLLPLSVFAWLSAQLSGGKTERPRARPLLATALLVAATGWVLWSHAAHSWSLRQRTMAVAIDRVVDEARSRYRNPLWVPASGIPMTAFRMRGIAPYYRVALSADPLLELKSIVEERPHRTIVVLVDRFIHNGMPINRDLADPTTAFLDTLVAEPGGRTLRRRGRVQAFIIPPRTRGQ